MINPSKESPPSSRERRRVAAVGAMLLALACVRGAVGQNFYEVTTTVDGNPGSLGAGLTSFANPATSDVIFFNPYLSPVSTLAGAYSITSSPGGSLTIDGNPGTTINFNQGLNAGLTVAGGYVYLNGLTATGITVQGGVLSTSYASINGLILNGGTFQTGGNTIATGVTLVGSGEFTNVIDVDGNNPAVSGITGAGDLTVKDSIGGGILTLNGTNNYTGATYVNSGTLQLGVSGALLATGNLSTDALGTFDLNGYSQTLNVVSNAGTIKTGLGTLTATSYSGSGTLSVALQHGLTNLVATNANLTGGTLAVVGHPALGSYAVVNAGTLTGTFSSVVLPYGVTDSISYVPGGLGTLAELTILSDSPFTFGGQSSNQGAVGAALGAASYSATGDLGSVINQLGAMSPAQINAALDQIGPISYAALSGMSFAGAGVQSAAVTQRLTGLQAGRGNADGDRFASFNVGGSYPGTLVAELPGDASAAPMPSGDKDRLFDPTSRWGFFVSGLGTFDHLDSVNGNSGFQPGYSLIATGETLGADYRFNEHFAAGVAAGYVNSYADLAYHGGNIYGQSARLGVYGTAYNDSFHANLYLGGAHDFYDTGRNINALSRAATASPSGQEFNLDALAGWDVKRANSVYSPFLGLAYDRMMLGSFTEDGAGALDLAVAGQTAESLRSTLGVKLSREFKPDWCDLTPFASVGWQHEFEDQSRPLTAALASGGSGNFTVMTADVARDSALLGAGLNMDWTQGFSTRLSYQSTLSFDFHANTFNGSMRWRF